jgi:hypothetical protein
MAGRNIDGIGTYPANAHDLHTYATAQQLLARQPVPVLQQPGNRHDYLFVASFDGSGQDLAHDRGPSSNVGLIHQQVLALKRVPKNRIGGEYVAGPGTQRNPLVRTADAMLAFSYDERIEQMYRKLSHQAWAWRRHDPDAQIRIAAIGYSRGAVEIPGFSRLVDRYGILAPGGLQFSRDGSGQLRVTGSGPALMAPGQVAQAIGLFDPVATSIPMDYDRRLPPSVISGFSLLAEDERRALFPHTALVHQGMTADGRFVGVTVAGAHSDVGGGNHLDGLEIRAGNLMIDYLNTLGGRPFLSKRALPDSPEMSVVHRSEQGLLGVYEIGSSHSGEPRHLRERLCMVVDPCRDAEPRDDALASRFAMAYPHDGPMPSQHPGARAPAPVGALPARVQLDDPAHRDHGLYRQAYAGVRALDVQHQRIPDARSERLAASLAVAAKAAGLETIDHVVLSEDRQRAFAVEAREITSVHRRLAQVEVLPALQQSLQASAEQLDQVNARLRDLAQPRQVATPSEHVDATLPQRLLR